MNELKVGDKFFVDIKRVGINGEGIAYYKKLAIFIPNALPKENIFIEITSVNKKYANGVIRELKKPSPLRVNNFCPYYNKCGGCSLQHLDYSNSGEIKKNILIEALNRYSGLDYKKFEIRKTMLMDDPFGYRYKATLPLRQGEHGVVYGMYAPNSEQFVRTKECKVQNDIINQVAFSLCSALDMSSINAYSPKLKNGYARYLIIRTSHFNLDTQVTFIFSKKPSNLETLTKLCLEIPHVTSVYYSINEVEDNVEFFGSELIHLGGKETILEKLDDYSFELLPNSFFQLNPLQATTLFNEVKKACKLSGKETVLDAYCGVGVIGTFLARNAKEVIGIESSAEAVINAKKNALLNKIDNIKFIEGDSTNVIPYVNKKNDVDILVVDPPRSGLDDKLLNTIMKSDIKKIIYVSCNPATLAKNLSVLKDKYDVKFMEPIDMFPFSAHVESITVLKRR